MRGLFVTGTDTGVGKTIVGAALLRLALRADLNPLPYKPVETGCDPEPADATRLWIAAGRPVPLASVCPWPLPLPAAPAQAAEAAGIQLDLASLAAAAPHLPASRYLLVEGAGGLLVPYAGAATAADLAPLLGLPLLVVARTALGTVNHTALTLRELQRRGLPLAGVVLVQSSPVRAPHEPGNADLIARLTGVRPFGTVHYLAPDVVADLDRTADAVQAALGDAAINRLLARA